MMKPLRMTLVFAAAIGLFLSVTPPAAVGQAKEPIQNPTSIIFSGGQNPFDAISNMSPITINLGSFSGSGTWLTYPYLSINTSEGAGLYQVDFEMTTKVSGTYKDGVLEGEWSQEGKIVEYPNDVIFGSVHTKSSCSGTFKSTELITSKSSSARFQGECVDYRDDYEESALIRSDRMEEVTVDATVYFKIEGAEAGGPSPGIPGTGLAGPAAPPGIGGIGDLPGPDNLPEAMAGILLPGIIGILGGLLAGGSGSGSGGGGAGWEEPPGGDSRETEPSDHGGASGADPATEHAKNVLDMFDKRTGIDKNRWLKKLADKARETAFDSDGNLIPEKWNEVNDKMREAISTHAGEPGSSSIFDELDQGLSAFPQAASDAWDTTRKGLDDLATGIGHGLEKSYEGWADGIMHPADFVRGVRDGVLDWEHKNTEDWRAFSDKISDAGKEGGLPAAVEVVTQGIVDSEKKLWGGLWEMGKELLPAEEFESLLDENASMEEKLWAIPAAATKIAGLLVGTELGGARVPGTGDLTLIPSERAAAAAGEKATAGSAAGLTEARAGETARVGKPAKIPGSAAKAEAGADAAAREAEKSAERLAEQMKGDKARAAAEQKFSDPAQRASYQSEYKKYMDDAQKKADAVVDTVKSGQAPSVDQALDSMSHPAARRIFKNAPPEARKSLIETENKILEPTKRDVEGFLKEKYKGEEIKVESVRTPGKNYDATTSINTDNDVHAVRKITNPDGSTTWKEVPSQEWEQAYHDSFAKNSGFTTDTAKSRFPEVEWDSMTAEQQTRKWGELHQQEPGDVFSPTSARDFRKISQDPLHTGPRVEESTHGLAKKGAGKLSDPDQLAMMEGEKFTKQWNKGTIPDQKEALEQLSKQGKEVEGLVDGYKQNYQVSDLSPKMKEALKVIEDNKLSPLERAEEIKKLGFKGGPQEVSDRLQAKITSLKLAKPK